MNLELTDFFKAAGDITRLRIINLLLHYPALNVKDISEILSVPQSKISRHLSVLRRSDWLVFNRREKWVYYKINPEINGEFLTALRGIFQTQLYFENDVKQAERLL